MANSKRRCPYCKEYNRLDADGVHFDPRANRLYCSFDHWVEHCAKSGKKLAAAHRKKVRKEISHNKRELNFNDRKFQTVKAQEAFNKFIRLTYAGSGCYTCDETSPFRQYQCGHFLSVGARGDRRFNEDNVRLQCVNCNQYNSGRAAVFRVRLTAEIGAERVAALELDKCAEFRRSIEDIRSIRSKYELLNKELESQV